SPALQTNPFFSPSGHPMARCTLYPIEPAGGISTPNEQRRLFRFSRSMPKLVCRNGYLDTRVTRFFRTLAWLVYMTRTDWNIWPLSICDPTRKKSCQFRIPSSEVLHPMRKTHCLWQPLLL